jgi:hypothetical protein
MQGSSKLSLQISLCKSRIHRCGVLQHQGLSYPHANHAITDTGFFKTKFQDIATHITLSRMLGSSKPRLEVSPRKSRNHAFVDVGFFKTKVQDITTHITLSRMLGSSASRFKISPGTSRYHGCWVPQN